MRNPSRFHFDAHDARLRRLRQLFEMRPPRVEQEHVEQDSASPPSSEICDASIQNEVLQHV